MTLNKGQQKRQERIERKLDELITRLDTNRFYQPNSEHIATNE